MRHIEPAMIEYIDIKLKTNGLAQRAIETKAARSLFIQAAQCLVGIREVGGNNEGPMVELIQKTIGNAGKEPWCMSFVQTCLAYAEVKTGITSPIYDSEHCITVWHKSPKVARVNVFPLGGAIVIWRRSTSTKGHTGVLLSADGNLMNCVEGNTESGLDPNGKVERDGGGIYHTVRDMRGTGSLNVVGFLKPFG